MLPSEREAVYRALRQESTSTRERQYRVKKLTTGMRFIQMDWFYVGYPWRREVLCNPP